MIKIRMMAFAGLIVIFCSCFAGNVAVASAKSSNDRIVKEGNVNTRFNIIDTITIGDGIKPLFPQSDGKPEFVRIHVTTAGFPPVLRWYSNGKKSGYLTKESHHSQAPGIIWFVTYSGYIK